MNDHPDLNTSSSSAIQFDENVEAIPNGPGAAAIVSAGIGCAMVGVLGLAGDASPSVNKALIFYKPTGALSGVTTISILFWLASWFLLDRAWRAKNVNMVGANVAAFTLLLAALLLTFPPFMDLLQGK